MESATIESGDFIEALERQIAHKEQLRVVLDQQIKSLKGIRDSYRAELPAAQFGIIEAPESRRFTRKNGARMRPLRAILIALRERNSEMPTRELFDVLVAGGAFQDLTKWEPETSFRTSLLMNVRNGNIVQTDAAGNLIEEDAITNLIPISGTTRIRRPGDPDGYPSPWPKLLGRRRK